MLSVFAPTNKTLQYCFAGELSQVQDLIIQREAKEKKEQGTSHSTLALHAMLGVFPMHSNDVIESSNYGGAASKHTRQARR